MRRKLKPVPKIVFCVLCFFAVCSGIGISYTGVKYGSLAVFVIGVMMLLFGIGTAALMSGIVSVLSGLLTGRNGTADADRSKAEQLHFWQSQYEQGIITAEDFAAKSKQILEEPSREETA